MGVVYTDEGVIYFVDYFIIVLFFFRAACFALGISFDSDISEIQQYTFTSLILELFLIIITMVDNK